MRDWRIGASTSLEQVAGTEGFCLPSPDLENARWADWEKAGFTSNDLMSMILDGALALDCGEGPRCGAGAAEALMPGWPPPKPRHRLAGRSLLAVKLAAQIPFSSPAQASRWLYGFGQIPARPQDARSSGQGHALIWSTDRAKLQRLYFAAANKTWESWSRRGRTVRTPPLDKLYVSPADDTLDEVLHQTAILLCDDPVAAFKIVVDRRSAKRPDKLIVYFDDSEQRDRWAGLLAGRIAGCAGQGVPFTDQVGDLIALSVATDPPPAEPPGTLASWRSWCADRLAWSLIQARTAGCAAFAPWEIALFRLSLEGVDCATWALAGRAA